MLSAGITYNQMVTYPLSDGEIDAMFHALADATRRDILRRSLSREHSISSLAREYSMSFAAVQKHVGVLAAAGLIVKRAEGRERLVRADPARIARARLLLEGYQQLWRGRVDRLDAILADDSETVGGTPSTGSGAADGAGAATGSGAADGAGAATGSGAADGAGAADTETTASTPLIEGDPHARD
jgi:DNA-binding transcriptional ArsR family regulator